MRITSSRFVINILPSPILPVCAFLSIASITDSSWSSCTRISSFDFGRKSTRYAPIHLGMSFLPTESFHLVDGQSRNSDIVEFFLNRVHGEGLNYGFNLFHQNASHCFPTFWRLILSIDQRWAW